MTCRQADLDYGKATDEARVTKPTFPNERDNAMDLTFDTTEQKVVKALNKLNWQKSNGKRTRAVKKAVGELGEKFGFAVATAHRHVGDDCEWLYDLCWCKEDEDETLLSMPLVMESEWDKSYWGLLCDFQKLLVSRADHRVLICSQPTPEDWRGCIQFLVQQVHRYCGSQVGDRYLFGCWTPAGWDFTQYVHPAPLPENEQVWLFQANENEFVLVDKVKPQKIENWSVTQNHDKLRPGDKVLLWQSGSEGGIYATGELVTGAYEEDGDWWADIRYVGLLDEFVLKSTLRKHPVLKSLGVIKMPHGRNPYRIYDEEWFAVKQVLSVQ